MKENFLPVFILLLFFNIKKISQVLKSQRSGLQLQTLGFFPQRREGLTTPVFWLGEFHGQRSLAGYSLWGHKESELIDFHFFTLDLSNIILKYNVCNNLNFSVLSNCQAHCQLTFVTLLCLCLLLLSSECTSISTFSLPTPQQTQTYRDYLFNPYSSGMSSP